MTSIYNHLSIQEKGRSLSPQFLRLLTACFLFAAFLASCDTIQNAPVDTGTDASLPISFDLPPIDGAGNLKMSIVQGEESMYRAQIDGLRQVAIPGSNQREGWSIFPDRDLTTGNSLFSNVTLLTTKGSSEWDRVNYLLNTRRQFTDSETNATRLELQAALWVLSPHLDFDHRNPDVNTLNQDMLRNGTPAYNSTIVDDILTAVNAEYRGYEFDDFSVYAVLVRGGSDSYGLMLEASRYRVEMVNLAETAGLSVAWDINNRGQVIGGNLFWDENLGTVNMGNIFARAINDDGMVAGSRGNKLMLWNPDGGLSEVQIPMGDQIEVYDINNQGEIAGEMVSEQLVYEDEYGSYYDYEFYGFVWDHSHNIREITRNGWSSGINDMGLVVGLDYTITNRAYKWDEERGLRGLGTYSGFSSGRPNAVNNAGEVVGSILVSSDASPEMSGNALAGAEEKFSADRLLKATNTRGVYDPAHVAEMLVQGTFSAESFPWGETAAGAEQSFSQNDLYGSASSQSEAFLWSEDDGVTRLGTLGGDWSTAWDINDYGQIAGYSSVAPGVSRAFLWSEEFGMMELPGYGGNSLARAVNDRGEVIGYSYDETGSFVPVKWTVVWNGF
ncbi:hypothetical protein [Rhodohalobacter mucosus]|uniref:YD repeat-containing protein n=1 Tax=Rhodohalobacter mucosus TaxID=2079485 RepID=A0A316TQM4_9BACT|nr:hypothetical protein [Rhodohalobacter mucosus]PWN06907.1 hypothetical protein DDZ15_06435 [Rhodohalobacter mucosus]